MTVVPPANSLVMMLAAVYVSLLGGPLLPEHPVTLLPATTIAVGGLPVSVEIADEPAERAQGLGNRAGLAPGTGMLFIFPEPAPRSFWMRGLHFCLDMVWIEHGIIQGATTNVCPTKVDSEVDLPTYASPAPVSYVLEVPAGWVEANGFGVDTPVDNLPPLSAT